MIISGKVSNARNIKREDRVYESAYGSLAPDPEYAIAVEIGIFCIEIG